MANGQVTYFYDAQMGRWCVKGNINGEGAAYKWVDTKAEAKREAAKMIRRIARK